MELAKTQYCFNKGIIAPLDIGCYPMLVSYSTVVVLVDC